VYDLKLIVTMATMMIKVCIISKDKAIVKGQKILELPEFLKFRFCRVCTTSSETLKSYGNPSPLRIA
jgi:hypothetical protein